jgi:hypothetical protein
MRNQACLLACLILLTAVLLAGCTEVLPGDVVYGGGNISFVTRSSDAIPDGVVEVAVFRIGDLNQAEVSRTVRNYQFTQGDNRYSDAVSLNPGTYRCFIYIRSAAKRYPVVIRDFSV